MDEITQTQNLNPHYTNSPKVVIPNRIVVSGPENIPRYHIFNDREANIKLYELNNDVYEEIKKTPKKDKKKFLGIF